MIQRGIFGAIWLGFVVYAFGFAPPNQPETFDLIMKLSTAQVKDLNPLIVALFNLMGIWPVIYFTLLVVDGRGQRVRAWPFAVGSFALGAFALLPYLVLRSPHLAFTGERDRLIQVVESKLWALLLGLGMVGLLAYGLSQGNWPQFADQWHSDRFIHVMSWDFCLLSLLFPVLAMDDLARRPAAPAWVKLLPWVPVLGAVVYLIARPPLAIAAPTATLVSTPGSIP